MTIVRVPKAMERMKITLDPKSKKTFLCSLDGRERFILPPKALLKIRLCGGPKEGYPFVEPALVLYETKVPDKTVLEEYLERKIVFTDTKDEIVFENIPPGTQLVLMPRNWL